jgi:hypothetical protein
LQPALSKFPKAKRASQIATQTACKPVYNSSIVVGQKVLSDRRYASLSAVAVPMSETGDELTPGREFSIRRMLAGTKRRESI